VCRASCATYLQGQATIAAAAASADFPGCRACGRLQRVGQQGKRWAMGAYFFNGAWPAGISPHLVDEALGDGGMHTTGLQDDTAPAAADCAVLRLSGDQAGKRERMEGTGTLWRTTAPSILVLLGVVRSTKPKREEWSTVDPRAIDLGSVLDMGGRSWAAKQLSMVARRR
jgi:hypothetical protein